MSGLWTEGEPGSTGYYLVLVRGRGHPDGNPWPFFARVVIEKIANGRPIYMDHHSGDDKWRAYTGGPSDGPLRSHP